VAHTPLSTQGISTSVPGPQEKSTKTRDKPLSTQGITTVDGPATASNRLYQRRHPHVCGWAQASTKGNGTSVLGPTKHQNSTQSIPASVVGPYSTRVSSQLAGWSEAACACCTAGLHSHTTPLTSPLEARERMNNTAWQCSRTTSQIPCTKQLSCCTQNHLKRATAHQCLGPRNTSLTKQRASPLQRLGPILRRVSSQPASRSEAACACCTAGLSSHTSPVTSPLEAMERMNNTAWQCSKATPQIPCTRQPSCCTQNPNQTN
jgi:hypothetical protein